MSRTPKTREPLTAAQQALACRHLDLVEKAVNLAFRGHTESLAYSREDARQDAALALSTAAQDYRPLGASFQTFVWYRLVGAIKDGLRRADTLTRQERQLLREGVTHRPNGAEIVKPDIRSLEDRIPGTTLTFGDVAASVPDAELETVDDLAVDVANLIDGLPSREAYVVRRVFYENALRCTVAGELGVSPSRVSQLLDRAFSRLREPVRELGWAA